jgi:hypothetical protein
MAKFLTQINQIREGLIGTSVRAAILLRTWVLGIDPLALRIVRAVGSIIFTKSSTFGSNSWLSTMHILVSAELGIVCFWFNEIMRSIISLFNVRSNITAFQVLISFARIIFFTPNEH